MIFLENYGYKALAGHRNNNTYSNFNKNVSLSKLKFEGDLIMVHKCLDLKKE